MVWKKTLPDIYGWKRQVIHVLNRRAGISTDRRYNLIFLMRQELRVKEVDRKKSSSHAISVCLEVKMGGYQYQLGPHFPNKRLIVFEGKGVVSSLETLPGMKLYISMCDFPLCHFPNRICATFPTDKGKVNLWYYPR